jgi:hypothetical protein
MCGWLAGIPLEFLVVTALVRGAYRRFPLVFLYAVANLLTTLVEIPPYVAYFATRDASVWDHASKVYWVDECVLQVLIFLVVISLIDQATSAGRRRRMVRAGLIAGALLFAGITFLVQYQPLADKRGYWMTPWTQDLSVCATVLDLALWAMLIASRQGDRRLLAISGGLGIQFTGEAIGAALRNLSVPRHLEALSITGSAVTMVANMACLYMWWHAFRGARDGARSPALPRPAAIGKQT